MLFFFVSFVAGILTVLAPCVLPLLPVIIGGSVSDTKRKSKPFIIVTSLSISVIFFTLLLKASTVFINIPESFWKIFSGTIILIFGLILLFPEWYERLAIKSNLFLGRFSNKALAEGSKRESFWGDIIIGASLGPVFSSCSPTYFIILATVIPESYFVGIIYLTAYVLGLSSILLLIGMIGQKFADKLAPLSDPHGKFKRILGIIFVIVGVAVSFGLDKQFQTYLINNGIYDPTRLEQKILKLSEMKMDNSGFGKYKEIDNPSGFINSSEFRLSDYIGKKVILLDFMTYSCINCQRTFPFLNAWYEKYKDKGLVIVGIHTPEFAFEKLPKNVQTAMNEFGIKFPIVMDNDYSTWNAYDNNYWPRKYLIDINGNIVYDHIGEGNYKETEQKIKELLVEREKKIGESYEYGENGLPKEIAIDAKSRETYFGSLRNSQFVGNIKPSKTGEVMAIIPNTLEHNKFYLNGLWNISGEFIESLDDENMLAFRFDSSKIYLVAESGTPKYLDFQVNFSDNKDEGKIKILESKLYTILNLENRKEGILFLKVPKGVRLYAFTFG